MTGVKEQYYIFAKQQGLLTDNELKRLVIKERMLCKHISKTIQGDFFLCSDCGKEL